MKGLISLTCDGWQASNINRYFAITGHWVEVTARCCWELKHSLFGFVHPTDAKSYLIVFQTGWITCDNAKNSNDKMLEDFAERYTARTGLLFDGRQCRMRYELAINVENQLINFRRCLAHNINLAMQRFIGVYSNSAFYNLESPDLDLDSEENRDCIAARCSLVNAQRGSRLKPATSKGCVDTGCTYKRIMFREEGGRIKMYG